MKTNFVEELKWRGMLHDMMPGTDEQLNKEMSSGYIGFDPTADSLHVGHLVQIMTLIHFQRAGHKPYALVGGATGMVGDPSGKSAERNLLLEDDLNHNVACLKEQLSKFLDFNSGEPNAAVMVNNYDWFKSFSFLDFIRDVGKHITVNYMMAKDSVKKRLEGDTGMSFTEFSYQLVQGYDFYYLWKNHQCLVQMGGSDQWGNIVTGTEFIRRKDAGTAFALTTQLIKKADGTKFGKTEGGNIWLDPKKTSPYDFYQFWYNTSDADAESFIKIFTLLDKSQVEALMNEQSQDPGKRILQTVLAREICERVHGPKATDAILRSIAFSFGKTTWEEIAEMDIDTFRSYFLTCSTFFLERSLAMESTIAEVLMQCQDTLEDGTSNMMFSSKGELKKLVQNNGLSINKRKLGVEDLDRKITALQLAHSAYLFVQKGKKTSLLLVLSPNVEKEIRDFTAFKNDIFLT